jgi:cytochrome c peroxidase
MRIEAPETDWPGSLTPGIGVESAPLFTDKKIHELYKEDPVITPSLIGVMATRPYLHDGSSPTLTDLLELVRDGSMGDTSSLSAEELDDLEVYLRSL